MRIPLLVLLLMLALISCRAYMAKEEFDLTTREYGISLRWKRFENAEFFSASSIRDEFKKRVERAMNVEVVDYRVIDIEYDEAKKKATVNAEISYYMVSSNRVRTLMDKQIWSYEKGNGKHQWQLITLLPEFK